MNCEILEDGNVHVGDDVAIVPNTYQPKRSNPGTKPSAFFIRPADRTAEQAKTMIIPPVVAFIMCLVDPIGFQRVEDGYKSAGQHFWSPKAYRAGMYAKTLRSPLIAAVAVAALAGITRLGRQLLA